MRRRLHVPVPCRKLCGRPGPRPAGACAASGLATAGATPRLARSASAKSRQVPPVAWRLGQRPGEHRVDRGRQVGAHG